MAKEGAAMLILGPKKGPMGGSMSDEDDEDMGMGAEGAEEEALSEFFSMGKAGNWKGAREALKTFIASCYPELGGGESDYAEGSGEEEP